VPRGGCGVTPRRAALTALRNDLASARAAPVRATPRDMCHGSHRPHQPHSGAAGCRPGPSTSVYTPRSMAAPPEGSWSASAAAAAITRGSSPAVVSRQFRTPSNTVRIIIMDAPAAADDGGAPPREDLGFGGMALPCACRSAPTTLAAAQPKLPNFTRGCICFAERITHPGRRRSPPQARSVRRLNPQCSQGAPSYWILGFPWEHTHPQQDDSHGKS
jgi:hypothetical protein